MDFKYIIISIILISNLSWAASSKLQKVFIKGRQTSIPLMEINNKEYIKAEDFSKLLSIPIYLSGEVIIFKNKSTEITFFTNSLISKYSKDNINYLMQLHLPAIFVNNSYFLPYPSVFTILDSVDFWDFNQVKHPKATSTKEVNPQMVDNEDDIFYNNDETINQAYHKFTTSKNKHNSIDKNNTVIHPSTKHFEVKHSTEIENNHQDISDNNHLKHTLVPDEISTFPDNNSNNYEIESDNKHQMTTDNSNTTDNKKIIHLSPDANPENNEVTNPENIIENFKIIDEFGGYKIPKSIKRKKLEELKKYYESK